jgi:hypothetical protein
VVIDLLSPSQLLPLIPLLSLLSLLSLMSMRFVRCLLGELDAAGHTDALEFPLLLTSNVIAADVKLDQRPHIFDGISDSSWAYVKYNMRNKGGGWLHTNIPSGVAIHCCPPQ